MPPPHPRDLGLVEARALVQRAVDKAEQLGLRGGIAVVGASGALTTASRLDRGGAGGMARARSKAWISATQQVPSTEHLHRMATLPLPISSGFVQVSPQAAFPERAASRSSTPTGWSSRASRRRAPRSVLSSRRESRRRS